jgi:hypothetical protein
MIVAARNGSAVPLAIVIVEGDARPFQAGATKQYKVTVTNTALQPFAAVPVTLAIAGQVPQVFKYQPTDVGGQTVFAYSPPMLPAAPPPPKSDVVVPKTFNVQATAVVNGATVFSNTIIETWSAAALAH